MTLKRYDEAKAIFESEDASSETSSLFYLLAETLFKNQIYDQALIPA